MKKIFCVFVCLLFGVNLLHAQGTMMNENQLLEQVNLKTAQIDSLLSLPQKDNTSFFTLTNELLDIANQINDKEIVIAIYVIVVNKYLAFGDYKTATSLCHKALDKSKKNYGDNNQNTANILNLLALCYAYNYDNLKAIEYERLAVTLYEQLGISDTNYFTAVSQLASFYNVNNNYEKTIEVLKKLLPLIENNRIEPDWAASIYRSLGNCYLTIENYKAAQEYIRKAMSLYPQNNDNYLHLKSHLAFILSQEKKHSEALQLIKEVCKSSLEVYGGDSFQYANFLTQKASIMSNAAGKEISAQQLELLYEAEKTIKEAISIYERNGDTSSREYVSSIQELGSINFDLGNFSKAKEINQKAYKAIINNTQLEDYTKLSKLAHASFMSHDFETSLSYYSELAKISKERKGENSVEYVDALIDMSRIYYLLNNYAASDSLMGKAFPLIRNIIAGSFYLLDEDERAFFWNKYSRLLNIEIPRMAIQLDDHRPNPEVYNSTVYDDLLLSKGILLNTDMILLILKDKESSAKKLSKALDVNWKDVQANLKATDVAIEFYNVPLWGDVLYVAATLKANYSSPHIMPVFLKSDFEAIKPQSYYTRPYLYSLIWKPLEEELESVKDIYFAPSDELHRIGIEYVPINEHENICERFNLHRLSSTRELVNRQDEIKGENTVIYGGLKYDEAASAAIPPSTGKERGFTFVPRANVDSLDIRGSYNYLPGTKEETDNIVSDLNRRSLPYSYYSGKDGTEESFKGLDGTKPKTLHIATHGFYMTEQDAEKKNFARPMLQEESRAYHEDKPMTRSGLLLSGCSRALNHESIPDGVEDGILTAQEISKLDLRGLDLVVLSACQTGLGDITSGEGVFGLQRGFKNAGARTIIMSLWKVSDVATQHLMTSFYNHYLSGMSKEQSFRMAQDELRKLIDTREDRPEWAAFVMLDGI